ncbi:MAG: carboxylating nicotinate-nucleotide diphosphorylase [Janthinobacterium lividum]
MLIPLSPAAVDRIIRIALEEDAPWGDLTSQALVPAAARVRASLVARESGVLSGGPLFIAAMQLTDPSITVTFQKMDGEAFAAGEVLAIAEGPARSVLQAERVALNFTQRLSGIATLTAQFVAEIAGTKARIVDTRKTTPGLRYFERYAVRCGGGFNHRFSLSDAVMAKDNHLAVLAKSEDGGLTEALRAGRARLPHTTHFEVEVDRLDQIEPVLAAGVDTVLLDNFSLEDMRSAVEQIGSRALVEASGSVRLDTVAAIARTGVDIISVGALTHSVRSLDLGLDILPEMLPESLPGA